jgi:hypothetical protein
MFLQSIGINLRSHRAPKPRPHQHYNNHCGNPKSHKSPVYYTSYVHPKLSICTFRYTVCQDILELLTEQGLPITAVLIKMEPKSDFVCSDNTGFSVLRCSKHTAIYCYYKLSRYLSTAYFFYVKMPFHETQKSNYERLTYCDILGFPW